MAIEKGVYAAPEGIDDVEEIEDKILNDKLAN